MSLYAAGSATCLGVRRGPSFLSCGKARGYACLAFGDIDFALIIDNYLTVKPEKTGCLKRTTATDRLFLNNHLNRSVLKI